MISSIKYHIKTYLTKKKWRKINSHNSTFMGSNFEVNSVKVGKETYGLLNVINHNVSEKLIIGNFCSIAPNVTFVLNGDHAINHISTYPFKAHTLHSVKYEATSNGDIVVDDDVWIGTGAIILSGVHIYQGAVIAAGAVVTKDVLPYEVVGGVPAKRIRLRFTKEIIDELNKIDFSKLGQSEIREHIDELYSEIKSIEQLCWLPRKCEDK